MSQEQTHERRLIGKGIAAAVGVLALGAASLGVVSETEPPRISTLEAPFPDDASSFDGSLRVASWNIRQGLRDDGTENYTAHNNSEGLQTVTDVLRFINADVICLQEVTIRAAHYIVQGLQYYNGVFDLPNERSGFQGILNAFEPEIGTLTLIASDLGSLEDLEIQRQPLPRSTQRGRYRSSQSVSIPGVASIVNTHLSPTTMAENRTQALSTAKLVQQTEATILCGDFNVRPNTEAALTLLDTMEDHTNCGATFTDEKARKDRLLDYIAWREFVGTNCQVPNPPEAAGMSDHKPVIIDLIAVTP